MLAFLAVLPFLFIFLFTQAVTISFSRLGLSPAGAVFLLLGSLVGGFINVPFWRRQIRRSWDPSWNAVWPWEVAGRGEGAWGAVPFPGRLFYYQPPPVREQIIAINVGGALIPVAMSLYLLPHAPLVPVLTATAGVAAICYALARPAWPVGIVLPAFVPPLAAALLALVLAPGSAAPVAYVAGTLGTLVGADLLHLPDLERYDAHILSIGGAGVHDGIFFAGLVAVLLT
jgi:uncharacterized membrane protein